MSMESELSNKRMSGDEIPLDIWLRISNAITSRDDFYSFSRVNKTIWSLLLFRRTVVDAKLILKRRLLYNFTRLDDAIRAGEPAHIIETITRACYTVGPFLLEKTGIVARGEPSLFVAAEVNRIDVAEILLDLGCRVNISWCSSCTTFGHIERDDYGTECQNALCVARQYGNREMAAFLLERGIKDVCGNPCPYHG
ncbi:hypothetical protein F5B20DRAFT_248939 [Whalleya microplaca]|nr:hypothetical protein F5B20DRAFT_248939 [Whalleya microplaca]